ncbi:HD-GYP domain-containing protein [Bacteriovorax sp. Seq25_V]|uniref:HD-GYP domain-containing protein n=1 Tax=Bacteriovorax sp. Seq25_V TaxID=1201288 RepID=UPI00038A0949|nr:HD domain-containing phosphohydrolase [Bacteriovorax sp. Seq25_V]EQC43923.1 HD domain protein [Bacteriovorax sp. Seq25_V]
MKTQEYFNITVDMLREGQLFPFHLYVYNPQSKLYNVFLYANSPLTDDHREFISFITEKGGSLAVDKKQKRTFLHSVEIDESEVPSLQARELSEIEIKRNEKLKALALEEYESESGEIPKYDLKSGMNNCIDADSFLPMILSAKKEIEIFQLNISHTVSLAGYLAEELLTEDNRTNRIVAISYYLAKNMNMNDQETLADIVCAAFFAHLGYTQLDHSLSHRPTNELSDKEKDKIKKHPGYSHHLLLKSGIEISERCKNIIFQHHERYDGSGYPRQKHSEFIDTMALILGAVSHILEYSEGEITGSKLPIRSVIQRMKNKTFSAGLEFEFGDKIYENLINLISTENISEAA